MSEKDNDWVANPSSAYTEVERIRKICRDMYDITRTYLSQLNSTDATYVRRVSYKEPDDVYAAKRRHGWSMNHMAEGVDSTSGLLLDKYVIDTSDFTDPQIEVWKKDMTGTGVSLEGLASNLSFNFWLQGSAPWMVEYSRYDPKIMREDGTVTDADRKSLRPYVKVIDPAALLEASSVAHNNQRIPGRIRVMFSEKSYTDPGVAGGFSTTERDVQEVLVATKDRMDIYVKDENGSWVLDHNRSVQDYGIGRLMAGAVTIEEDSGSAYMMGSPPFQDVAITQMLILSAEADNGYNTSIAQIPFLFLRAIETLGKKDAIEVGSVYVIRGQKDSDVEWKEISGTSIKAGVDRIERLSSNAQAITGQIYAGVAESGDITATSQVLSMAGMKRYFARFLQSLSDNLTQILCFMLERNGNPVPEGACVKIVRKEEGIGSGGFSESGEDVVDREGSSLEKEGREKEPSTSVGAFVNNTESSAGVE